MLSRRWLVNGLLVLVIALLVAVGYRLDRPPPAPPQTAHAGIDTAAVERIEIRLAEQHLLLQRQQRDWLLLEPFHWPADRAAVERLFRVVDTGETRPLESTAIDLASLGLEHPLAELRLGETAVRFGIVNNIGERRYTLIDAALYLLPDVHLPLIQQGPAGFIDRRMLPAAFEVSALRLPDLEMRRDADGTWRAVDHEELDSAALAGLVADWQRLEPTRIGAYEDPRAPAGRVVAELRDGAQIELLLLATDPEVVIANPALGMQYHFRGELYERLFTPRDDENSA